MKLRSPLEKVKSVVENAANLIGSLVGHPEDRDHLVHSHVNKSSAY